MLNETIERQRREIDALVDGKTIVDIVDRNAEQFGHRPAIHWKEGDLWRNLTWSQYRSSVHEAAAGLLDLGVGPGDFVAIMASNRPEHVIADLAAVHTGGTGVTIYSTLAANQIQYIAGNCEAKVAILENIDFMKRWESIKSDLPHLTHVILMEGAENYPTEDWVLSWADLIERGHRKLASDSGAVVSAAGAIRPDGLATLIYTSGTTGTPKGVMITHRNVLWTVETTRRSLGLENGLRGVSYLPLAHIAERVATHYMGIYLAGEIYYCPDISQVLDYVTHARPQLFVAVPRVWEKFQARLMARFDEDPRRKKLIMAAIGNGKKLIEAQQRGETPPLGVRVKHAVFDRVVFSKVRDGLGMDQVERAGTAAAPINRDLLVFFHALGIPVYEIYGMSENTGPATLNRPGANKMGTVGQPLDGIEIETAEDGEVRIRGGIVTAGYYKLPEQTRDTFTEDGWLLTGDLGTVDDEGFLTIVGRKKEIIITAAGKNIAPAKLETILKNHPLVSQACMIGDKRQYLTMLLALDPEEAPGWAKAHRIAYTDFASFCSSPEVDAEIQQAVDSANATVARVEQIKKFVIVSDEWSPDTGEITPSLKLKRQVVMKKYAGRIEAMYAG